MQRCETRRVVNVHGREAMLRVGGRKGGGDEREREGRGIKLIGILALLLESLREKSLYFHDTLFHYINEYI